MQLDNLCIFKVVCNVRILAHFLNFNELPKIDNVITCQSKLLCDHAHFPNLVQTGFLKSVNFVTFSKSVNFVTFSKSVNFVTFSRKILTKFENVGLKMC